MRLRPQAVFCVLVWIMAPAAVFAQHSRSATHEPDKTSSHLLTPNDGLAILSAAMDSRHRPSSKPDCSHLVHAIYEKAGYPYAYQSSSDLFAGVPQFRRVQHPQPGDLIVWRGHAGIVINPVQHTFYSSLRSGFGVNVWDSAYWRRRGSPRFLRYLEEAPRMVDARTDSTVKAAGLHSADAPDSTAREAQPDTSAEADLDVADPGNEVESATERSPIPAAAPAIPSSTLIHTARPKSPQVNVALREALNAAAQSLQAPDMLRPTQSIFVFDRIDVQKVNLKDSYGWAEVRITGPASIEGDSADLKKRSERQRWTMVRRDHATWELSLPTDVIYLPREAAARILAHQLATLTDADSEKPTDHAKKLQLAHVLNILLETPRP
jgi:NlpC/P60 family